MVVSANNASARHLAKNIEIARKAKLYNGLLAVLVHYSYTVGAPTSIHTHACASAVLHVLSNPSNLS